VQLSAAGVAVREIPPGPHGLDIAAALREMRTLGVESLLVEGGARIITSLLRAEAVDRFVVSISPTIIGAGVEAVGPLGITQVADGVHLRNRSVYLVGDDVVLGFDVRPGR